MYRNYISHTSRVWRNTHNHFLLHGISCLGFSLLPSHHQPAPPPPASWPAGRRRCLPFPPLLLRCLLCSSPAALLRYRARGPTPRPPSPLLRADRICSPPRWARWPCRAPPLLPRPLLRAAPSSPPFLCSRRLDPGRPGRRRPSSASLHCGSRGRGCRPPHAAGAAGATARSAAGGPELAPLPCADASSAPTAAACAATARR